MDYLNLKILKRCCQPNATEMDETESNLVNEILLQYLIMDLNVSKIIHSLYSGSYISDVIFKNVQRILEKESNENELKMNKRVISYLTNKVSFVALLWALSTCGYQTFANLLLSALEKARCSAISPQVRRTTIIRCRSLHLLVKQLKYISDSRTVENPVTFLRHLGMRFKEQFTIEIDVNRKRKIADKYFAVLAVELDNFTFMKNSFVSVKSLAAEIRRIVPFTSNPVMNEALVNGRIAEVTALRGDISAAVSLIQDVVTVILNTEACPESANLFYIQLNVLLQSYEKNPSEDNKKHFVDMGYNGIRLLCVLDEDIKAYLKIFFMLRIIFCALDLSINGRPICFQPLFSTLETAQYLLSEVSNGIDGCGLRKLMCYSLAMGRVMHLKGNVIEAVKYLKKARKLAQQGGYIEFRSIDEYERKLSGSENVT